MHKIKMLRSALLPHATYDILLFIVLLQFVVPLVNVVVLAVVDICVLEPGATPPSLLKNVELTVH